MINYFDASALTKRYVAERGSERVIKLLREGTAATSRLSIIEVTSALARRCRQGDLKTEARDKAVNALRDDARRLVLIELTPTVAERVVELLLSQSLRTGDAIQLASCIYLKERVDRSVRFIGFDENLNRVAQNLGLEAL